MSRDNEGSGIWLVLIYIYLAISQGMTLYFLWQWGRENSFINTITLGFIASEFKGLLWIFFVW